MFFRAIYLNKTTVLIGQSEGLPNITGHFYGGLGSYTYYGAGCFYNDNSHRYVTDRVGSNGNITVDAFGFNASRGETKKDGTLKSAGELHLFGNSDHITPCNATIKVWQRIS